MPNLIVDFGKSNRNELRKARPMKGFMWGLDVTTDKLYVLPPLVYQFQYNPNEKTDHKKVNWVVTNIPGHHKPLIYYSSGGERRIEFKLMINAYEYGYERSSSMFNVPGFSGIRTEIAKLMLFMQPNQKDEILGAIINKVTSFATLGKKKNVFNKTGKPTVKSPHQFNPPPACIFGWGAGPLLKCVIEDIVIKETLWNNWLDPIRAEAQVKLLVDERSAWSNWDDMNRRFLATLGLVNVNPFASIPGAKGRLL